MPYNSPEFGELYIFLRSSHHRYVWSWSVLFWCFSLAFSGKPAVTDQEITFSLYFTFIRYGELSMQVFVRNRHKLQFFFIFFCCEPTSSCIHWIEKGAKTWTINIWNLLTTEERALPFSGVFLVLSSHIFAFITLMKIFRYAGHAAAHQSFTSAGNIGQKTKKGIKAFPKLKWHFYYLGKWCIENESLKVLTVYMKIQFLFFIYHCCNLFFFIIINCNLLRRAS